MHKKDHTRKRSLSANNISSVGKYDNFFKKIGNFKSLNSVHEESHKNITLQNKSKISSSNNMDDWTKEMELISGILLPKPTSSRSEPLQTPRDDLISPKSNYSSPRDLVLKKNKKKHRRAKDI